MDCNHQAPFSLEFSRQEYWSGLPFPSPGGSSYRVKRKVCDLGVDHIFDAWHTVGAGSMTNEQVKGFWWRQGGFQLLPAFMYFQCSVILPP